MDEFGTLPEALGTKTKHFGFKRHPPKGSGFKRDPPQRSRNFLQTTPYESDPKNNHCGAWGPYPQGGRFWAPPSEPAVGFRLKGTKASWGVV